MATALLTLLLGGCVKNEFDVEVSLPERVSGHYSFLYYASDPVKGWFAEEMCGESLGGSEHGIYLEDKLNGENRFCIPGLRQKPGGL